MRFQLIVCPLLVLFLQLFVFPLSRCPVKAVWSFANPHLPVAVANRRPAASPSRRTR